MVFSPPIQKTNFQAAYESLSENDKRRIKHLVCAICEIHEKTFYEWLKNHVHITKGDRYHICIAFNANPQTFFLLA